MFPEDVGKDEVSFQQDTKKLLSHVRLGLAVKEKTKTEIIRDSVTKPQLLATPKFSELLNVYDAQQEIIHAKDPRSLFAKLNKYIVTLVLASEVEGVKFESADHDLVKESLAFMQKYMRAEKFKMTIQDINKIVSEELYRRDGKLTVTYNIKLPKMDDKAITKSASEMSSKNTIRFIHFIDAVIERNQDAAFMLTDTSQDDMDNPYLAIIQAHIDYLNCIKNLSLALDTTLDYMTSVPERNAILRNILIHIHSGADSVELLEKALNAFPELEQLKKQRLLTTLAPHIKDIIASKLLVEKKKKSCFKMEDLPEKIQARAAILTSLGVNLLAVDDLLHDDKIQRENERSRLKSFFVPDSGSDKKDSAMESQIINLLIGGRFSPLVNHHAKGTFSSSR